MKNINKRIVESMILILIITLTNQVAYSQQVEVQGALKVTQMTANDTQDDLVIRNTDGTLGTRSVASLPPPPPSIDTTRNLASDFELAKHLCDCPTLPPFMIKKLLDSGYTQEELVGSGVSVTDVVDAQRGGILIDSRDNQSYKTVTIGVQTWMAENLNYGTMIISGSGGSTDNSSIEKFCYDDNADNCDIYGGLYQWNEMMQYVTTEVTQGICPTGWHLPTDGEWQTLEIELGMTPAQAGTTQVYRGTNQGSQLAANESLWINGILDQNGAFGSSGFGALPGSKLDGLYGFSGGLFGNFFEINKSAYLWSSSNSIYRKLNKDETGVLQKTSFFADGMSVRCIMD